MNVDLDLGSLRPLWEDRLAVLLANLASGEREYAEIANAAAHIEADYHGRFLHELTQNAADQAGAKDVSLTVIRTANALAVLNDGRPFSEAGRRAITSLALSPKDPAHDIGNKGVGFKAVFEVCRAPVILGNDFEPLTAGTTLRLRLDQRPFDAPHVERQLELLADAVLERSPELARAARQRLARDADISPEVADPLAALVAAAREAAPFKFPLPLTRTEARALLDELEVPAEVLTRACTAVILPLRLGLDGGVLPEIDRVVDTAVAELHARAGETALFLERVACIRVIDRGTDMVVRRRVLDEREGVRLVETSVGPAEDANPRTSARHWWVLGRELGGEGAEGDRIQAAARELPGPGWSKVRTATVSVALPVPGMPEGTPLLPDGRLFIGLPTLDQTGTPLHVDARFHGTLSRKGIDLKAPYNAFLFAEAVTLSARLIDTLKRRAERPERLAVTLSMARSTGALADALHAPGGLASGPVVLDVTGTGWIRAAELRLPSSADGPLWDLVADGIADIGAYGFVLADPALVVRARAVLDALLQTRPLPRADARYLARPGGRPSLLEHAAQRIREAGPSAWEPLLDAVLERFDADELRDQRILPVHGGGCASADERVFFEPKGAADEEVDSAGIGPDVLAAMRLFDGGAIDVRVAGTDKYTPLAARVAPHRGGGLVHLPRLLDLLRVALAPALQTAANGGDDALAFDLLRLGLDWIAKMEEKSRREVRTEDLRVPAANGTWVPPGALYFGRGWLDDPTDEALLEEAYGALPGNRLADWTMFETRGAQGRELWRIKLEAVGVAAWPRILQAPAKRNAPLVSHRHKLVSTGEPSPFPGTGPEWFAWLDRIGARYTWYRKAFDYDVTDCAWVDGLERPEARRAVVALMLRNPEPYEARTRTQLLPRNGSDEPSTPDVLWVDALRYGGWAVVPVEQPDRRETLADPATAWWVDQRSRRGARLLPRVPERHLRAVKLLRAIGVCTIEDAPVARLVHELQALAARPDLQVLHQDAQTLARDLWRALQRHADKGPVDLSGLLVRPVPLMRGRRLTPVDLAAGEPVYVEDDPLRCAAIPGYDTAARLPFTARESLSALAAALEGALGRGRVLLTSSCEIDTGFSEDPEVPEEPLLDAVERMFPGRTVALDLASLVAYGGQAAAHPGGAEFERTWRKFQRACIVRGHFAVGRDPAFYDSPRGRLEVAATLGPTDIVGATWLLVGPSLRHTWAAWAASLEKGVADAFFASIPVGDAERAEVEAHIGAGPAARWQHLAPTFLALRPATDPDDLLVALATHGTSAATLAAWLGHPEMEAALEEAREQAHDQGALTLLAVAGVDVGAWQEARGRLGLDPWEFPEMRGAWTAGRAQLVAALMAGAARTASVSLPVAGAALAEVALAEPPRRLILRPDSEPVAALLARTREVLARAGEGASRLLEWLPDAAAWTAGWRPSGATEREVRTYRDSDASARSRLAREAVDGVLELAGSLATHLGERLDVDTVRDETRVAALRDGAWANVYAALHALHEALQDAAPATAARLSGVKAFHDHFGKASLWAQLRELGPLPTGTPKPAAAKTHILAVNGTRDELEIDLGRGAAGQLGSALIGAVDTNLDLAALSGADRPLAPPPGKQPGPRSTTPNPGSKRTTSDSDRELVGAIGEAFVYEQLSRLLPDFDATCWVSENRQAYGLQAAGADGWGFDFRWVDVEGRLGVTPGTVCLLEVKATASEDVGAFPVTDNEWSRAGEAHRSKGVEVYFFVRVVNVRTAPRISDLVPDPWGLEAQKRLRVEAKDRQVFLPRPG